MVVMNEDSMANRISADGWFNYKVPGLQGRDAETVEILERLYNRLSQPLPADIRRCIGETEKLVNELSGLDRHKLYFAMYKACIAANRVFNLTREPRYLEFHLVSPDFPLNIKQDAIVHFAFTEGLITQDASDVNCNFIKGCQALCDKRHEVPPFPIENVKANRISANGVLSICKVPGLQGRDAEAFAVLERIYECLPNAISPDIQALVNELSGMDRGRLYLSMKMACFADRCVLDLATDPEYLERNFRYPSYSIEIKYKAIVQLAFTERFMTQGYPDFTRQFHKALAPLPKKSPSFLDRVTAFLRKKS
jgi:hypothetical protein